MLRDFSQHILNVFNHFLTVVAIFSCLDLYHGLGISNFILFIRALEGYSKLFLNKFHYSKSVVISVSKRKINH